MVGVVGVVVLVDLVTFGGSVGLMFDDDKVLGLLLVGTLVVLVVVVVDGVRGDTIGDVVTTGFGVVVVFNCDLELFDGMGGAGLFLVSFGGIFGGTFFGGALVVTRVEFTDGVGFSGTVGGGAVLSPFEKLFCLGGNLGDSCVMVVVVVVVVVGFNIDFNEVLDVDVGVGGELSDAKPTFFTVGDLGEADCCCSTTGCSTGGGVKLVFLSRCLPNGTGLSCCWYPADFITLGGGSGRDNAMNGVDGAALFPFTKSARLSLLTNVLSVVSSLL